MVCVRLSLTNLSPFVCAVESRRDYNWCPMAHTVVILAGKVPQLLTTSLTKCGVAPHYQVNAPTSGVPPAWPVLRVDFIPPCTASAGGFNSTWTLLLPLHMDALTSRDLVPIQTGSKIQHIPNTFPMRNNSYLESAQGSFFVIRGS